MPLLRLLILACVVFAAAALTGCDSGNGSKRLPGQVRLVNMQIGSRQFQLEIADDRHSREKGLMYRQTLPSDGGMIFVFDDEEVLHFWMRNTYIPLDIVFIDRRGQIVAIRRMKPLDETTISSDKPAKYAIELNEGTAARVGIKIGDTLAIPSLE